MRPVLAFTLSVLCSCAAPEAPPPVPAHEDTSPPPPVAAAPTPRGFFGRRLRTEPIDVDGIVIPRATVCVPPEADDAGRTLPVLYALDGDYYLDELDLCGELADLARDGAIDPWVVVSIGSTEHRTDTLARHPDDLARVVIEHLEPQVAALVPLLGDRDHRAVIGYSYGGLAAVHFALARPDDFGRVVAMSPSLWWAGRSTLGLFRRASTLPIRLYVDAGAREGDPGEVVPYMVDDARALVGIARMRGMIFGRDVALREEPGQVHDMANARVRIPGALQFALGAIDLSAEPPVALDIHVLDRATPRAPTTFSINARYAAGLVLTWPPDLADVHLGSVSMDTARLPPHASALTATVRGVSARRDSP